MRRLDGKKGVEKIVFGREIYFMRIRRSALIIALCFVSLAVATATGFAIARSVDGGADVPVIKNENEGTPPDQSGGETGEKNTDDNVQTEEEGSGDNGASAPESNGNDSIVYKDFSRVYPSIVNNTVFDVSFVNSASVTLPKYYEKGSRRPIVLILHTYTSDRYVDSESKYGVCAVGQLLSDELNSMGICTVYSSAVHDGDMNDPAENARDTIELYLKMYPSIRYIFDVGIMQEYDGDKIVATDGELLGERAAQVRLLVAGNNMSNNRENLYLATEISKNLSRGEMNLAREILYDDSIKNSTYTPYYLEMFIGSAGNREEEGMIAARVLADAFAQFLN